MTSNNQVEISSRVELIPVFKTTVKFCSGLKFNKITMETEKLHLCQGAILKMKFFTQSNDEMNSKRLSVSKLIFNTKIKMFRYEVKLMYTLLCENK